MTSSDPPVTSRDQSISLPPSSPCSEPEVPIIATDDLGMIAEDDCSQEKAVSQPVLKTVKRRTPARPRRKITYISSHFLTEKSKDEQEVAAIKDEDHDLKSTTGLGGPPVSGHQEQDSSGVSVPRSTLAPPRIYYGLNVDELSSDSSLSDVPDDIGPDPFLSKVKVGTAPSKVQVVKVKTKKSRIPTTSPYFPLLHKHRPTFLSTLPFPPLSHEKFGLMQERLAHDPFRLLIATIFLNKTPGERAMPVFYQLMSRYPTPMDLANAEVSDITSIIHKLGFQNQRARKCVAMAKVWTENPPKCGKRYKKQNYPVKGDGRGVANDEVLDDDDERVAWEISHLPGLGPYSHDSWRMFCRDELRGVAKGWNGDDAADSDVFEPEWKRVIPLDKELRAWLTWMWLKEGWVWNKETGHRTKAGEDLMKMANGGGIVIEEQGSEHLTVRKVDEDALDSLKEMKKVERTAGDFLPAKGTTFG